MEVNDYRGRCTERRHTTLLGNDHEVSIRVSGKHARSLNLSLAFDLVLLRSCTIL